jgi:hypothetical protein
MHRPIERPVGGAKRTRGFLASLVFLPRALAGEVGNFFCQAIAFVAMVISFTDVWVTFNRLVGDLFRPLVEFIGHGVLDKVGDRPAAPALAIQDTLVA